MKQPTNHEHLKPAWIAFALSFVLPGAGLAYLGRWFAGGVNLVVAIALPAAVLLGSSFLTEHIHYVYLTIAVGSGAWAHATAERIGKV